MDRRDFNYELDRHMPEAKLKIATMSAGGR